MKITSLALFIVLSINAATALNAQRQFPLSEYDPASGRTVWVFTDQLNSSLTEAEAEFAATHYVGTQKITRAAIDRIRQYNEDFIHLHYKLGVTVDSAATYWFVKNGVWISNNRVAPANWVDVRDHWDWFQLDSEGKWTTHEHRRMVMNLANPDFRDWWIESCIEEMEANGADGVFADTYTIAAVSFRTDNNFEQFHNVNWQVNNWIPTLNSYGEEVYNRLEEAGYYFFPNIDNLQTTWANNAGTHYSKGENIHGAMLESFGRWGSGADMITALKMFRDIQEKGVFLHGQGYINGGNDMNPDLTTPQKRMWMVGLYLLDNVGRMYIDFYDNNMQGSGTVDIWYPEYELDLGAYTSVWDNLSELGWKGVYRRDYEKGFVLVNMDNSQKTVDLEGTFYQAEDSETTTHYWADPNTGEENVSLKYTAVSQVTMPARSAAVFVDEPPSTGGSGCEMELKGDFNGDGNLSIADVIAQIIAINVAEDNPCLDFNEDGAKNITDAIALVIYIFHSM